MPSLDTPTFLLLVAVAVAAGFIDAIAGGGGLLTVPALALANIDPRTVLATNKLQSSFGSGSAALALGRAGQVERRAAVAFAVAAALGAIAGALALAYVPQRAVTIALPFVLFAVATYFALSPRLGDDDRHRRVPWPAFVGGFVPLVGFYDGLFGPGTGSFFMIGCVSLLGFGLLKATAHTKVANFASNVAGLVVLALSGHVLWGLGLAMGLGQFAGARIGAGFAVRHGGRLVKPLLITVSLALALKLALASDHPIRGWLDLLVRAAAP